MNTISKSFSLPRYEDYTDCFVAFVDILGFDSRARKIQSEDDFNKIAALLSTLKTITLYINNQLGDFKNLNAISISDSFILSMPVHDTFPPGISIACFLYTIQYELFKEHNTIIRGYMTRGPIFHKDNIIFGKGYSQAYQKEKEIGHAPRIIIDLCLVKEIMAIELQEQYPHGHILDLIRRDQSDGFYFIDYLKPLTMLNNLDKMKTEREEISKIVKENLIKYCDDQKIIRKYNWLSNYILLTDSYYEERQKS